MLNVARLDTDISRDPFEATSIVAEPLRYIVAIKKVNRDLSLPILNQD
jgi:hypothetical protein